LTKRSPNGNAEWLWNRYAMAIAGEEIAACHDDTEEIEEARGRPKSLADIA